MKRTFLTKLDIISVRHLHNISIPISDKESRNLILTGRNGSGKTSVLQALRYHLEYLLRDAKAGTKAITPDSADLVGDGIHIEVMNSKFLRKSQRNRLMAYARLAKAYPIETFFSLQDMLNKYEAGEFIFAYYGDERRSQPEPYKNIEKMEFQPFYGSEDNPGTKLGKYLVNLKAVQAFSGANKDGSDTGKKIEEWFARFTNILRDIFEDPDLTLDFNINSFQFTIRQTGHDPFGFDTLSSGYSAILEIVSDLIMRMEAQSQVRTSFDMEGIVLIDEVDAHLHLELQKKILPILTGLFPNIQFIVSTHSPFVLNSLENAVIYDLEKNILVQDGMKNLPYEGIVEGYFGADRLSEELREKYDRYAELVNRRELSDDDYAEIDELEYYLDEIPDYLAPEITSEYSRLKLELANRR